MVSKKKKEAVQDILFTSNVSRTFHC